MERNKKLFWMTEADAEERRKQFEQILHEHEEIVTAITHQSSTEGYEENEERLVT